MPACRSENVISRTRSDSEAPQGVDPVNGLFVSNGHVLSGYAGSGGSWVLVIVYHSWWVAL